MDPEVELNPFKLKAELQCFGLKRDAKLSIDAGRVTGAGPSGGRYFILPEDTLATIPLHGDFIKASPYCLKRDDQRGYIIERGGKSCFRVELIPPPRFYEKTTNCGIPMSKIALLHGRDCLATTVNPYCIYWRRGKMCLFCGIEIPMQLGWSIGKKDPQLWIEVLEESIKEGVCSHITLTCGEGGMSDRGSKQYYPLIRSAKERYNIPIYVQTPPPSDFTYLDKLLALGVDSIGINIESFDPSIFSWACPGKSADSTMKKYFSAWKYAIDLFGDNQVSTFII
ncbi:MAG: radical SAM protein, partial [Candidatus Bathyarchaeia archaeon]